MKVLKFSSSKNSITANVEIESLNAKQEIVKKKVNLKVHLTRPTPTVDLFEESGGLPAYEGFVFDGSCMIDAESGEISFLNGVSVAKGSCIG